MQHLQGAFCSSQRVAASMRLMQIDPAKQQARRAFPNRGIGLWGGSIDPGLASSPTVCQRCVEQTPELHPIFGRRLGSYLARNPAPELFSRREGQPSGRVVCGCKGYLTSAKRS